MRMLDLFSGIGGISLAAEWAGIETVAFCEIEPFPQKVLKKHWPNVPIYDDVRTLTKERLEADGITPIDIVCGGFPCQPYSIAGKRKGKEDDRDLWPEMFRVIQEIHPSWVVGENVANFVNMELERTLSDLESEGYETQTFIIPACAVNAPHKRDRTIILAHTDSVRVEGSGAEQQATRTSGESKVLANTSSVRCIHREHRKQPTEGGEQAQRYSCSSSENVAYSYEQGLQGRKLSAQCTHKRFTGAGSVVCNSTSERLPDWAGGKMGQPKPVTEFERPDGGGS